MPIRIRPARTDDFARCLELLQLLASGTRSTLEVRPQATFEQLVTGERGEILVADEAGTLLGMASVSYNLAMRYDDEYCQLEELIVDPAARGRNVGGLLVAETVARARQRGCGEYGLYLIETTEHNLPFYEKYGFAKVGSELRQRLG